MPMASDGGARESQGEGQLRAAAKRGVGLLPSPVDLLAMECLRWLANSRARRRLRAARRVMRALALPREVQGGPFRGMKYHGPASASQGGYLPKLLGTYELELAEIIARAAAAHHDRFIDIGAAEGYYAVGFALASPTAGVTCFEIERPYHTAIRQLARRNDVSARVRVLGACTPHALERELSTARSAFVLCDCEGAEEHLLRPDDAPSLRRAAVLVELHELYVPGIEARTRERFSPTHSVRAIDSRERTRADSPAAASLADEEFACAMDEGRGGPMRWLYMAPRI